MNLGHGAQSLIWPLLLGVPILGSAQTCATPPAPNQPTVLYNCVGGLCENIADSAPTANCPVYDAGLGGGTPSQFYTCSVANYYAQLARYFGQLTYGGETVTRTHAKNGEIVNIAFAWNSESNGKYQAILQSVLPINRCPSYWLLARAPSPGDITAADSVAGSIDPATGNVHFTETDVELSGPPGSAMFQRFYNSVDITGIDGVPGWRHSYSRRVEPIYQRPVSAYPGRSSRVSAQFTTPATACTTGFDQIRNAESAWVNATPTYGNGVCVLTRGSVTIATLPIQSYPLPEPPTRPFEYDVIRDNGQIIRYTIQDGIRAQPGVAMRLTVNDAGFTVVDGDRVETYDGAGVLRSVSSGPGGLVQRVAHDSNGRFSGVTDTLGHSLTVSRNPRGEIASITASGGKSVQYAYDNFSRLETVTSFDGATKTYIYDDPLFLGALTSVLDTRGAIIAHWAYDSQERGTTSYGRDGDGAVALLYGDDGRAATSTDALGLVRRFRYTRAGDIDMLDVTTDVMPRP
jgi:YD repeat-containing protein